MDNIEIVDGTDTLRPYISDLGVEVHKVYNSYKKGLSVDDILSGYRNMDNVLSDIDGSAMDAEINIDKDTNASEIEEEHIKMAIEYANDNEEIIQEIQNEQDELTRMLINGEYKNVNLDNFEYFDE